MFVRNRTRCQEVKSWTGGRHKVGRAPATDPEGRCLVVGREVEREMREREGRINLKLHGKSGKITSDRVRSEAGEISVRNSDRVRCVRGLKV